MVRVKSLGKVTKIVRVVIRKSHKNCKGKVTRNHKNCEGKVIRKSHKNSECKVTRKKSQIVRVMSQEVTKIVRVKSLGKVKKIVRVKSLGKVTAL